MVRRKIGSVTITLLDKEVQDKQVLSKDVWGSCWVWKDKDIIWSKAKFMANRKFSEQLNELKDEYNEEYGYETDSGYGAKYRVLENDSVPSWVDIKDDMEFSLSARIDKMDEAVAKLLKLTSNKEWINLTIDEDFEYLYDEFIEDRL